MIDKERKKYIRLSKQLISCYQQIEAMKEFEDKLFELFPQGFQDTCCGKEICELGRFLSEAMNNLSSAIMALKCYFRIKGL